MARLIGVCLIIVPITFSSVAAADNSNYNTDTLTDAELMSSSIEIDNVVDSSAMTYQTSFDDDMTASELDAIDAVPAEDEFSSEITDDYDNDETYDDSSIDDYVTFPNNSDSLNGSDNFGNEGELEEGFIIDNGVNDEANNVSISVLDVPLNAISPQTIEQFVEVIDVVRQDYVDTVNDEALFQYAIIGMLNQLDSHAEYLTPPAYDRLRAFTDGEIGQVGLQASFQPEQRVWIVDAVSPNASAYELGVRPGDRLLSVKEVTLNSSMTSDEVEQLLSGIAGSQVAVSIKNSEGQTRNLLLQRDLTKDNKLSVYVSNGVAVVRLPVMQNSTKTQLLGALRQVNVPLRGVVLDVRNNPGGVLSAATDVASLFVNDNPLIQVRNRVNPNQIIAPNGTPYLASLPVVVLQNRYSASAAEVLASALQSNGGTVMGETSFGKGTVQEVLPLQTGGALKLTVAEYRSANGNRINGVGIIPNITLGNIPSGDTADRDTSANNALPDFRDWQRQAVQYLLNNQPTDFAGMTLDLPVSGVNGVGDY